MAAVLVSPRALLALGARPDLWPTAASLAARVGAAATPDYLQFRRQTMFGSGGGRLDGEQLVGYLGWCRMMRQTTATRGGRRYRRAVSGRRRLRRR